MSSNNIYGITLKVWDDMSSPISKIRDNLGGLTRRIKNNQSETQKLKKNLASFSQFDKLTASSKKSAKALHKQEERVEELSAQIKASKNPSDALLKRYKKAKERLKELDDKHKQHRTTLGSHIKQMKEAGIDTKNLSSERERLGKSLDKVNDKLRVQRGLLAGQKKAWKGAKAFGGKAFNLGTTAVKTGIGVGAAGIGVIANFNKTAAEFERYQTILETLEGSKEKAGESFDWIKDFTTSTPYELGQVTDAFVKLRSYGLDPISGDMLKTLGDTSAAMGKDLIQTVEAIADAVTGENERLKEFGIKASTKGNKVTYNFTNSKGEQLSKTVDKNNRKAIQSTLQSIWNEKYAGNMDKMSKTWGGMWSNLMDQITNFKQMVMSMGAFDFLKDKLEGILFEIEVLATGGQLEAWAKRISDGFISFAKTVWDVGTKIYHLAKGFAKAGNAVASFLGGWDNLVIAAVAFKGIGMAASIAALSNPLGLVVAGVVAFGAGVSLVYRNWDRIKLWFSTHLPGISKLIKFAFNISPLSGFINQGTKLKNTFLGILEWFQSTFPEVTKAVKFAFNLTPIGAFMDSGKTLKSVWAGIINWFKANLKWLGDTLEKLNNKAAAFNPSSLGKKVGVKIKNYFSKDKSSKKSNFGGGRAKGGSVQAGMFYEVNEKGPELIKQKGRTYLMNSERGEVIPFRNRLQQPQNTLPKLREQQQQAKVSGSIHVKIDSDKPVTVKKVESTGMDLNLETGMVGFAL